MGIEWFYIRFQSIGWETWWQPVGRCLVWVCHSCSLDSRLPHHSRNPLQICQITYLLVKTYREPLYNSENAHLFVFAQINRLINASTVILKVVYCFLLNANARQHFEPKGVNKKSWARRFMIMSWLILDRDVYDPEPASIPRRYFCLLTLAICTYLATRAGRIGANALEA